MCSIYSIYKLAHKHTEFMRTRENSLACVWCIKEGELCAVAGGDKIEGQQTREFRYTFMYDHI